MQWLQDPNQSNLDNVNAIRHDTVDNLNTARRELVDISGTKEGIFERSVNEL
jgi:hypothetical protein